MPQQFFSSCFSNCHFVAICWFLWFTHHYILDERTQSTVPKIQYLGSAFPFHYFLKTYITASWMWGMQAEIVVWNVQSSVDPLSLTSIYMSPQGGDCSLCSYFRMSSVVWKITNYVTPHYIIFSISLSFNAHCFQ